MSTGQPQDFVTRILEQAASEGASDVYFLPSRTGMDVRFRCNGIQRDITTLDQAFGEQCLNRLKVLAGLLTYRTRVPQDGLIRTGAGQSLAEIRAAIMPTRHGERATLRFMHNGHGPLSLDELNFQPTALAAVRSMLMAPSGLLVLTGPTGCGKTTTIYAMVRELLTMKQDPASIITLEDPIESELDGVSQVNVTGDGGESLGYAAALRASLRQDVKTLVVGEMRDADVVRMTLDAALTGHRVITTYHAGDIASVYSRMLHQGFEPFLVASAVTGIVSQRLVVSADGTSRVPVVATMNPDDAWRDFVTQNPGLADLRRKLADHPSADIAAVARQMADAGIIPQSALLKI